MIAAQVAHAAGSTGKHPAETHVVVLQVDTESELRRVSHKLRDLQVKHEVIVESDAPHTGCAMSLGCALVRDRELVRRALSSLPLLGKGSSSPDASSACRDVGGRMSA